MSKFNLQGGEKEGDDLCSYELASYQSTTFKSFEYVSASCGMIKLFGVLLSTRASMGIENPAD